MQNGRVLKSSETELFIGSINSYGGLARLLHGFRKVPLQEATGQNKPTPDPLTPERSKS